MGDPTLVPQLIADLKRDDGALTLRILFSSTSGAGHLGPLVPYAQALARRGHEVRVSSPEGASAALQRAGLAHARVADPNDEEAKAFWVRLDAAKGDDAQALAWREGFSGSLARSAMPALQQTLGDWRPDLIVRESAEFAALVAAERAAIPHARVAVHSGRFEAWGSTHVVESLDALRRAAGLDPDGGAALRAEKVFTAFPASLDGDGAAPGGQAPFRVAASRGAAVSAKETSAWATKNGLPFVYVTLGTVSGRSERVRAAYRDILEALGTLPVSALLTTGPVMTAEALGTVPDNVTVRDFVPQAEVFPHATAVVCHGGSGTLLGGLAARLPMVVMPLFADQPYNARAVEDAGAGVAVLQPEAATLRTAIERVLNDSSLRAGAGRIADEMSTMASMGDAAGALLALARARAG